MIYRAVGIMSGSSLDGLDIAFVEFQEQGGKWTWQILESSCMEYSSEWAERLKNACNLNAREYQLLHTAYGRYIGQETNRFIEQNHLEYKVAVIGSHGHTSFHMPEQHMTAQLGDGAAIAAFTRLPVVSDLRSLDVALGGQGAPIVPIGEKLLLSEYQLFLNIGGIANISFNSPDQYIAYDICPANRVLNMLAAELGKEYDEDGALAASGKADMKLLDKLNALEYYSRPAPKSLANDFGTDQIYPMITQSTLNIEDSIRTYTEHIVTQIKRSVLGFYGENNQSPGQQLLVTGGGAFNKFLIQRLNDELATLNIQVVVPDSGLVKFKEAMIMAFIAVLRWRQEFNVLSSVPVRPGRALVVLYGRVRKPNFLYLSINFLQ